MSALARYYLQDGWFVTGSDLNNSELIKNLSSEGILVNIGHTESNMKPTASLVIRSQAIQLSNPEVSKALSLNTPVKTYPEALGDLTRSFSTIAVAGAHGKSTTTAMVSLIFSGAGLNPTTIVGTKLKEFKNKNFKKGTGKYLVLEADEYGAAFLNYHPAAAIITNIDKEHLDFYKNFAGVKKAFLGFISNIKEGGLLVLNKDNKNLVDLKKQISPIARKKKLKVVWYSVNDDKKIKIKKYLQVYGVHNLSNAVGAYTIARNLGIKEAAVKKALAGFTGTWRRMELVGKFLNADVYDDYGHNPAKAAAALQGLREKYPQDKIVCVFQPHQATRLMALFKEFTKSFKDADNVIFLDVYKVAGRDQDVKITSKDLAAAVKNSVYLADKNMLIDLMEKIIGKEKGAIVMMGAGDIVNLTPGLLAR